MTVGSPLRLDLGLPRRLQLETAKLERQRARGSLVLLLQAKLGELLQQANLRMKVKLLVWTADPPSPRIRRASWRPPLLEAQD